MTSVVIVAGGSSTRYGETNKLEEKLFDVSVLEHSVNAFVGLVDEIIVVGDYDIDGVKCVHGGDTRFLSVRNGLDAVDPNCDVVAVHDGARPYVSRELVKTLLENARAFNSAIPVISVTDTIWQGGQNPHPLKRDEVVAVQTPQCFNYKMLKSAFDKADRNDYPDESSLFWATYGETQFVRGEETNKKVTYYGDVPRYRVGVGFDVHAFGEGNGVILGGVAIPFNKRLVGHSDADVVCHALCDAILSASGNKDIGHMFPDTDLKYAGADSTMLLRDCVNKAAALDYEVVNVSAVIICEQPKIAPYIDKMAARIADVIGIAPSCVNLTATTTEKLGALGKGDGIAVEAHALLKKFGL